MKYASYAKGYFCYDNFRPDLQSFDDWSNGIWCDDDRKRVHVKKAEILRQRYLEVEARRTIARRKEEEILSNERYAEFKSMLKRMEHNARKKITARINKNAKTAHDVIGLMVANALSGFA